MAFTCAGFGCGSGRSQPPPASVSVSPPALPEGEEAPISADEGILLEALSTHASHLTAMGERNVDHIWELAEAADYIALSLEAMGYPVQRQGYETPQVAAQNLTVAVPGRERGDQVLVVSAHYDSPSGAVGEPAAWSTAALLELARLMRGARLTRSLRLTFLSMGEAPHARGHACAAAHSAEQLITESRQTPKPGLPPAVASAGIIEPIGVLVLGDLKSLRRGPPFSDWGEGGARTLRSSASLQISSNPAAFRLEQLLAEGFEDGLVRFERRSFVPNDCDARAFSESGLSVVALGQLSVVPGEEVPTSFPASVPDGRDDAEAPEDPAWIARQSARVVMRVRAGIGRILGERPSNDGMMTLGEPKDG